MSTISAAIASAISLSDSTRRHLRTWDCAVKDDTDCTVQSKTTQASVWSLTAQSLGYKGVADGPHAPAGCGGGARPQPPLHLCKATRSAGPSAPPHRDAAAGARRAGGRGRFGAGQAVPGPPALDEGARAGGAIRDLDGRIAAAPALSPPLPRKSPPDSDGRDPGGGLPLQFRERCPGRAFRGRAGPGRARND